MSPDIRREESQGYPPTILPWQEFYLFNLSTTRTDFNAGSVVHRSESIINLQVGGEKLGLKMTLLKPLGKVEFNLATPPVKIRIESMERLPLENGDAMRELHEVVFQVNYMEYLFEARPERKDLRQGILVFENFQRLNPDTEIPPFITVTDGGKNPYSHLGIRNVSQILGRFVSIGKLASVDEMLAVLSRSAVDKE